MVEPQRALHELTIEDPNSPPKSITRVSDPTSVIRAALFLDIDNQTMATSNT